MTATAVIAGRQGELLELTSARGVAALAVLVYHIDAYCGGILYSYAPTQYFGPLAVDFFFALSGFVLAHVYRESWRTGSYSHGFFLIRRFARVWPLHMACMLAIGAIVLVGSRAGLQPQWEPTVSSFVTHAALLQATGLAPEKAWNQPSWSVSAEWTAYLLFPLYLLAADAFKSAIGKLAIAAATFFAFYYVVQRVLGLDLFALTTLGALRIVPMFFAGVVLKEVMRLGYGATLPYRTIDILLAGAAALLYAAMTFDAPMPALWIGLLVMLYLLALRATKPETSILRAPAFVWLGDISYSLYLVHAAVLMVVYGLGAKILGVSSDAGLIGIGLAAAALSIVLAALGHVLIERPAQRLVLRLARMASGPRPAVA